MADLDNKIYAIQKMQNIAKQMAELADDSSAMQSLISARGWTTTGAPTDAELEQLGIKSAQVTAFVGLLAQYNRLMAGQAVTTIQGRTIADAIKAL